MAAETPIEQWRAVQSRVRDALQNYFPYEGRTKKLVLHNLAFEEKEAAHNDIRSQEQAKDLKKTWGVPIYGEVGLVDKATGKEVDRARIKLLTLPKPTNRYSYIVDGSEWQVDNMWRLRSGVYANVHANGKLSTEFNLAKPFAQENRLYVPFDPKTKQFKLKYGGSLHTSLYSVLRMMGVQDEDMKKAWGEDIYKANATPKVQENILKFQDALAKRGVQAEAPGYDAAASALVKEFEKTRLLPEATKISLGKPIDRVTGEALLLASQKILGVAKGEVPPDDRNSLVFKTLHGVDDFLHEKLTNYKTRKNVNAKLANGVDRVQKVRDLVSGDLFNKPIKEFFTSSTLSRNPEQVNPLEMISNHRATTIIGEEGGIKNERAVLPAMKIINPSHFGFLDPIHTPESERTGINLNLPIGVKKVGNDATIQVFDLKEKKFVRLTPAQLHSENIVMPDHVYIDEHNRLRPINPLVKMKDPVTHEIVEKPFKEGRYLIPTSHQLFDESSNLIPFLQCDQGNRAMMAAKQAVQAMSLHNRELPLVQVQSGGDQSWEKLTGVPWSHTTMVEGTVAELKKNPQNGYTDSIVIKDEKGKHHELQIYNHFPLNDAKTMIHSTPIVKVGDHVKRGQIVADSNFTTDGHLTLGTNLRVAYLPYKGYNFDDGIVISESAAKKLTSEHLHRHSIEIDPDKDVISKKKFMAYASTAAKKLTHEQINKLGDDGIIRVGEKVLPGDVLIAAVGKPDLSADTARMVGRLGKQALQHRDKSVKWDSEHPGEVVKVVKNPNGKTATVYVKALEPAEIGDKIVGRHANKAIITRILPDHEMPLIGSPEHVYDDHGNLKNHAEVIMNPSGVPSRINLGQLLETAAGKIAEKTGKPYMVNNFAGTDIDYTKKVKQDLDKHGIQNHGYEPVYDAKTGQMLNSEVLTGPQYILKLKHQVEKKLAVRNYGAGPGDYSIDQSPKGTGAAHPGQAMGQLEFYAMLAHGARANLREMATYKADSQIDEQMNPQAHVDFWDRVRMGMPLPAPKPTFAFRKFETMLKGLGINIHKEGNTLQLMPLTDKGVLAMSNGEIKDGGRVLRGKDAKELEKGLFDPRITGGLPDAVGKGLHWSHITLAEPVPNPVFVGTPQHPGPAVVLTGLKFNEFEDIVKGKKQVDGLTGGKAINALLKKIDVKKELDSTLAELPKLRGTARNHANQKARFLTALDRMGLKPQEAYVVNHVPIIPPVFRPVVVMPDGALRYDDVNGYYQKLALVNNQLKNPIKELPDSENQKLREQLYDLMKATAGLGGTPVYDSNRKMKGILEVIKGDQPKEGYFQKRIMKRRQELSMRSTIIPEPAMHLDYVGLPKSAALELYKPFVVREMRILGYSPVQALKEIKEEKDIAWKALQRAMDKRPVLLKRDPALHKFSVMAFRPRIVEGKAIQIHPLVTHGYNADFDGDTMSAFVPLTDDAVRESYKMLPSNNLFSATHGGIMYAPDQESLLGLHLLSRWGKNTDKSFSTYREAMLAKDKGVIKPNDVIKVGGEKTTLGRLMIAEKLPDDVRKNPDFQKLIKDPSFMIMKRSDDKHPERMGLSDMLDGIARTHPHEFSAVVDHLKNIGNQHAYEAGFSIGLKDLDVNKELRDKILSKADEEAHKIKALKLPKDEKEQKVIDVYRNAESELNKAFKPYFEKTDNKIFTLVNSGAKGKWAQFRQMTIAPMLMQDGTGKTLSTPVKKSYSEGLDIGDYWTALHGARKGTLQRVEGTSEPGSLTKEIVNVVIPNIVVSKDCGTTQGISLDIHDPDVHDRFLAADTPKINGKTLGKAGDLVTPELTALLKKHKIDKVVVRSPLKCAHGKGICAECYGLNENGHLHEDGVNIGVLAGQALGEPATQLAMDSFHTGGVASSRGGGSVDKFTRLRQLLGMQKTLPGEATLSTAAGKIEKIEKDPATNGHNIFINGSKHFAPAQRTVLFKAGDQVKKGDPLTDGPINPHQLLPLTDIHRVQNYLTDELYNAIYKDERVKRRNIETVVRGLTNLTRIKEPGDTDYLHGDIALRTLVEEHNRHLEPGEQPVQHTPIIKGAAQTAMDQHEDWMARLNFRYLQNTILEGAAKGWKTNLHGLNPIPAYAHGAEFGKGTTHNPHHY